MTKNTASGHTAISSKDTWIGAYSTGQTFPVKLICQNKMKKIHDCKKIISVKNSFTAVLSSLVEVDFYFADCW